MRTISFYCKFLAVTFVLVSIATASAGFDNCSLQNGSSGPVTNTTQCYVSPDKYWIKVYDVGVCKSVPTAPTGSQPYDVSTCKPIFHNASGATLEVKKGVATPITGTITRPSNDTFSYVYFIIAPYTDIQTKKSFIPNRQARGSSTTGGTCWSRAGNRYGYSLTGINDLVACGSTVTNGDNGITRTWTNSFSGQPSLTYGTLTAYLLGSNNKLGNGSDNSMGNVVKILGVFTQILTVADTTTGLDIAYNVTQGASVEMTDLAFTGGRYEISAFAAGSMIPIITAIPH